MSFVAPYAAVLGVSHKQAVERINFHLETGELARLVVDNQAVAALAFTLHGDWQVIASTDPSAPVALASSGRDRPTLLRAAELDVT
ncbi:hypothetical protein ABZ807_19905 [Micromonospora sp. NPDC047548]|uniref:hypothetical protein n=1 Tax=Micromonospora sp. NPDC047548 TaxID=3155624 RepID=UPI0033F6A63B